MKKSNTLLLIVLVTLVLGYLAYKQIQEGFTDASGACDPGAQLLGCTKGVSFEGKCYYCEDGTFILTDDKKQCRKTGKALMPSKNMSYNLCVPNEL